MNFVENAPTSVKQIADLREAVSRIRMKSVMKMSIRTLHFSLAYMTVKSSLHILTLF
jgi:hypothetical protein